MADEQHMPRLPSLVPVAYADAKSTTATATPKKVSIESKMTPAASIALSGFEDVKVRWRLLFAVVGSRYLAHYLSAAPRILRGGDCNHSLPLTLLSLLSQDTNGFVSAALDKTLKHATDSPLQTLITNTDPATFFSILDKQPLTQKVREAARHVL